MILFDNGDDKSSPTSENIVGLHENNLIDAPLALMPQIIDKYETRFWGVQQSELYKPAGMIIPKLPMYHPYHPFKNVTHDHDDGDDYILQVPLAIILPNADLVPQPLLKFITEKNIDTTLTPYFIAQTLPYESETEVICRYQYCLFPDATSEMMRHQTIWAQSIIYEHDKDLINIPPTAIKIYESEKNALSPTILCGNSMKFDTVLNLKGKGIWSIVLGSNFDAVDHSGLFTEISQIFIGFTCFIPDGDAYNEFLLSLKNKSPAEIIAYIPSLIHDVQANTGHWSSKVKDK